jgi:hypothetical protein
VIDQERLLRDTFRKHQDAMPEDNNLAESTITRARGRTKKRWASVTGVVVAIALVGSIWWLRAPGTENGSEPAQWTSHSVDDYWSIVDRMYSSLGPNHPTTCERFEEIAPDGLALPPAPHGSLTHSLFGKPPPARASEVFNARWDRAMQAALTANEPGPPSCLVKQEQLVRLLGNAHEILGMPPGSM